MMNRIHNKISLKWFTACLLAVLMLWACSKRKPIEQAAEAFKDEIRLKITPVKNQGNSSMCWIYAMLATIETEHLMQGDSVNLSPLFMARHFIEEQALRRYMLANCDEKISLRGVAPMLLRHLQQYGAMSFDAYRLTSEVDFSRLLEQISQQIDANKAHCNGIEAAGKAVEEKLDCIIGPSPRFVFMFGCEYTPLEFAHSVCRAGEYEALTSFTHHPFGKPFVLEVADNYYSDTFQNVPIEQLVARIDEALEGGHPVCWEGDISEPLFLFETGVAKMIDESKRYTQEQRQRSFENKQTTDDHCMCIVGRARDHEGNRYYLCKNSWGSNNPFGGLMYMSENYLKMKTIAVVLPRVAGYVGAN